MAEITKRRREVTVADVAREAGVGKATAARALGNYGAVSESVRDRVLAALRAHGFLDWLRRHERVEVVEDAPGPRVRQVSNAYRLSLPTRAAQLLGHWLSSSPPLPDDVAQEREDRVAWLREHKAALPLSELPLVEVEDDRLARVLGDLGRAVEARAQAALEQDRGDEACS